MARGRILVADDETHIVQVLALKFRNAGHEVFEAHDGEEALELARRMSPDAVVTDYQMPFMNGAELAEALSRDPGLCEDTKACKRVGTHTIPQESFSHEK